MKKGKFIVLYGINNLGKTTQLNLLADKLGQYTSVKKIKYAIYDLAPSGPILNDYLRNGNPYNLSPREFQIVQALNRTQFEATLAKFLDSGTTIISEDYLGTSIAWGMGALVEKGFLEEINSHLLRPDIAILLDGKRFVSGIEKGHVHESDGGLTDQVRQIHLDLAHEYGWYIVNANQTPQEVHADIYKIIKPLFM